jgi:proteasome lid subunit RPN8/RPN11
MTPSSRAAALQHAREDDPREACGLLVVLLGGSEVYQRCRNLGTGNDQFVLAPYDYARASMEGEVVGIVHSHPGDSPEPSPADRLACDASGLPWHIVATTTGQWHDMLPHRDIEPLIGREYSYRRLDCYSLLRDWYYENGIMLPDFERPEEEEYWKVRDDVFGRNFSIAGFREVDSDTLQPGDMVLFRILSEVDNHCAVYIGDNLIIHHMRDRLSCREPYSSFWRRHTTRVLRHENHRPTR